MGLNREFKVGDLVTVEIEDLEDRYETKFVGTILECSPDGTYKVQNAVDSRLPKNYRAYQLSHYVAPEKRKRPVKGPHEALPLPPRDKPILPSHDDLRAELGLDREAHVPVERPQKHAAWVRTAEEHITTNGSLFSFKIKFGDKVFRNNHGAFNNLDEVHPVVFFVFISRLTPCYF